MTNENTPLTEILRLSQAQHKALAKLGIETVRDLLYHIPSRYESAAEVTSVADASTADTVTIYGKFSELSMKKSWKTKVPMAEGKFSDGTGSLRVVWFHQPYLAKMIPLNALVRARGKITESKGKRYLANPVVEKADGVPFFEKKKGLFPVYPESRGVTSLWFYHAIKRVLSSGVLSALKDPIPDSIRKRYHLPSLSASLVWVHEPKRPEDAEAARKRFALEEVFLIQVGRAMEREAKSRERSYAVDTDGKKIEAFIESFPFAPTGAQRHAIRDILEDFEHPHPMNRLLEGDVGSGKTAVAAATTYAVATSRPLKPVSPGSGEHSAKRNVVAERQSFGNLQVAYMVPTEILAKQHFKTFTSFFKDHPIQIGLITSSQCYKFPSKVNKNDATKISRNQLLKWVANGEIPIVIGTHALIQKSCSFKHLAYVIIDEQHRFGTLQRHALTLKSGVSPHLLSMTATPIPRTLALTLYGDLDLTILDELPEGRRPVRTEIVTPHKRDDAYEKIRSLINEGRQAYVIVPRIDEPDPAKALALQTRSVASEMKNLAKVFPEFSLGKLHSKMTPKEKEDAMNDFVSGKTHILVATSVVEVGVNVPNATVIMIEGAERFGLAQLHQLRGRVMRSAHEPHAFLMVDTAAKGESARLKAIVSAKNGFELAEKDLSIRGAGELYGRRQWGISDVGMDALKNLKLVEAARETAITMVKSDPTLARAPFLRELCEKKLSDLHFE